MCSAKTRGPPTSATPGPATCGSWRTCLPVRLWRRHRGAAGGGPPGPWAAAQQRTAGGQRVCRQRVGGAHHRGCAHQGTRQCQRGGPGDGYHPTCHALEVARPWYRCRILPGARSPVIRQARPAGTAQAPPEASIPCRGGRIGLPRTRGWRAYRPHARGRPSAVAQAQAGPGRCARPGDHRRSGSLLWLRLGRRAGPSAAASPILKLSPAEGRSATPRRSNEAPERCLPGGGPARVPASNPERPVSRFALRGAQSEVAARAGTDPQRRSEESAMTFPRGGWARGR